MRISTNPLDSAYRSTFQHRGADCFRSISCFHMCDRGAYVSFNAFDNMFQHSRAFSHPFKCFSVLRAWEHDFGFQMIRPLRVIQAQKYEFNMSLWRANQKWKRFRISFSSYIFYRSCIHIWDFVIYVIMRDNF